MQTARRLVKGPDTAETSEKNLADTSNIKFQGKNRSISFSGFALVSDAKDSRFDVQSR